MIRDQMIIKAENDGGVCPLCGCWIMAGDVLLVIPETSDRVHRCCHEARKKPPNSFTPMTAEAPR